MPQKEIVTCAQLAARLLSSPAEFDRAWLGQDGRRRAPVPAGPGAHRALARRMATGARTATADTVLAASLDPAAGRLPARRISTDTESLFSAVHADTAMLLSLPDLSGAVLLVPDDRYALVAGDGRFLAGALPEGVDTACARFSTYARRIAPHHPAVAAVAARFVEFQQSWKALGDVPDDSHTGRQLALMHAFSAQTLSAEDFARGWLDERRRSLDVHERVGGRISRAMADVFHALDDFSIDPSLRDDDDLTPDELRAAVDDVLLRITDR